MLINLIGAAVLVLVIMVGCIYIHSWIQYYTSRILHRRFEEYVNALINVEKTLEKLKQKLEDI